MARCKDCMKRASFGNIGENPRFCATHKLEGMINVTKKICVISGCKNQAQGSTDKCKKHGGSKRCIVNGCESSAADYITSKCKKHGGGKICSEPGCKSGVQGITGKCKKHGGGKICSEQGCKSKVISNNKCWEHYNKKCIEEGCETPARYGYDKCKKHGGDKRCIVNGCSSSSIDRTGKCGKHGGGIRCPNCIDWIDSRCGQKKYDGYCATCFKRLFPEDKRSKVVYSHTKEIIVRNAINDKFEGFIHDRPLYTGDCDCTHRRRIDHRKLIGNTILAIETDEFGHSRYDETDEIIRYDDVYMIHSGKWIFIRFNPDGDKRVDMEDKLENLIDTIAEQIGRIENEENQELLEIIKLY